MTRTEQLEKLIKKYATSYYTGEAEVSDEYFDKLVDELRFCDPDNNLLKTPGWGYEPGLKKFDHWYNLMIGSLDKVKEGEEIPKRFTNLNTRISAKLDGLSVVSYYINGELVQALTRGNGHQGIDVTSKIRKILRHSQSSNTIYVPRGLFKIGFTGAIRGEVVMPYTTWESDEYKVIREEPSANPRNFASGIMNRKDDTDELKDLRYVVYKVIASDTEIFTKIEDIDLFLKDHFKYVVPCNHGYVKPIREMFDEWSKEFPCDGLVFSILNDNLSYDEIAYKFEAESKEVVVNNITYDATRTGRIVPLIWFDPIELSGAMVQKCTGYNAKFIEDNKVGIGSRILVQRSNEVIPKLVQVLEEKEPIIPTICPKCGSKLHWKGTDLVCDYENESQLAYHFISTISPLDGAGYSLYQNIVDTFELNDLDSIVKFLKDMQDAKYDPFYAENVEQPIVYKGLITGDATTEKARQILDTFIGESINPIKFLVACSIPGLGETTTEALMNGYPEFIKDLIDKGTFDKDKVLNIKGIGESLVNNLEGFKDRIIRLAENSIIEDYKPIEKIETKFKVAITGSLSMKRADFDAFLQEKGIYQSDNFKEIKFLITNNPNSGSSKMKKATELGIEIISEQEFVNKYLNN